MGIMYKLMKHRNLNMDLNEPLNNRNMKSDRNRNRLITIEGNIIEAPVPASNESTDDDFNSNADSNMDKQFTAEHIIQLCKFLAEKSKRNKNLYKLQQSPKKLTKSKQSQFTFIPMDCQDNNDEVDFYQNEALPLINQQRLEQHQQNPTEAEIEQQNTVAVLSIRLSPDINSLNISSNNTTARSCALQQQQQQQQQQQEPINTYHQQQQHQHQHPQPPQTQGKRDILLKIRRQIFERKRLRENGAFQPQAVNHSQVWRPW